MNITRKDLDDSIIHLTITLEPIDYAKKFDQKLATTATQTTIKGFRKGKTPASVIKKMYGHNLLGDMIDEQFNTALTNYIKDNNIKFIAQPLISEDQEKIVIDLANNKSYSLTYELGLIPHFEVFGASEVDTYDYFVPMPKEDMIDTELSYIARRLGKLEDAETISGDELVTVTASEMEDGVIKEGGFSKDVILFMNTLEDQFLKALLLTKKLNDSFNVEVDKLENKDHSFVKKNLFGLPEDFDLREDEVFHYFIKKISKLHPAELTDELIKEKFQLDNMEALKAEIFEGFNAGSRPSSENLLRKAIMDNILSKTNVEISESFVKLWLKRMENMEDAKINEELDKFKSELKWTYIKDELTARHHIDVTEEDLRQVAASRIRNYEMQYGKLPEDSVKNIVKNWYSDKSELYNLSEEARTNKLFNHLFTIINKEEKTIPAEEFDKLFNPEN
jgi:trigger factor